MQHCSLCRRLALAAGLLLASQARAQTHFSVGPRVGLAIAGASFSSAYRTYRTPNSPGTEAGAVAVFSRQHVGLQMALLFSQKGFKIDDEYHTTDGRGGASSSYLKARYRFNYLTLPLQVVYALRADGQGAQVFAGGYVGYLLGGNYDYQNSYSATYPGGATGGVSKKSGPVVRGDYFPNNSNIYGYADDGFYSRALDAGLQAGLGYRFGRALVQASYSHGLRNLAADLAYGSGSNQQIIDSGVTYRNRAW